MFQRNNRSLRRSLFSISLLFIFASVAGMKLPASDIDPLPDTPEWDTAGASGRRRKRHFHSSELIGLTPIQIGIINPIRISEPMQILDRRYGVAGLRFGFGYLRSTGVAGLDLNLIGYSESDTAFLGLHVGMDVFSTHRF